MEKHPDDRLNNETDPFKGDPNYMASLARGLEVIQVHAAATGYVDIAD